jgi:hypothetical protein
MKNRFSGQGFDLSLLSFSARIDYITIRTPEKVNLPALSGKAIWPQAFSGHRLTVHDACAADIEALKNTFGPAGLVEMEVAIDLRLKKCVLPGDREAMLKSVMVDVFARGLEPSAGENMAKGFRAFYRKLETGYMVRPFSKGLPRATDQQLHGGRQDAVQVKGYWKRFDNGKTLPAEKQVARVEVRLGSIGLLGLDLLTLSDVQCFRFRKKLMPYFSHVRGTTRPVRQRRNSSNAMRNLVAAKQHELDQTFMQASGVGAFLSGGKRAGSAVRLMRDTPVNNRIGQALTRLERQFSTTKFVRL